MTEKQLAALKLGCSAGGKAVRDKQPPERCPRCNRRYGHKRWHQWLGHLRIHAFADKLGLSYKDGFVEFIRRGLSAGDPAPWNGWVRSRFTPFEEEG